VTVLQDATRGAATKSGCDTAAGAGASSDHFDSVAVLKNFADRQHITFPLLSDPESKIIRAFDILNETVAPGTAFYGIPNRGTVSATN
jgi:peroxiredoxin